jgi:hypothetical protein
MAVCAAVGYMGTRCQCLLSIKLLIRNAQYDHRWRASMSTATGRRLRVHPACLSGTLHAPMHSTLDVGTSLLRLSDAADPRATRRRDSGPPGIEATCQPIADSDSSRPPTASAPAAGFTTSAAASLSAPCEAGRNWALARGESPDLLAAGRPGVPVESN